MTESGVIEVLERAHPAPAWAFFVKVANGTGANGSRYADAMAMSLYPSRGLDLWGFEVKVDRGDWLRELKDPDKAEAIAKYCDHWAVAAAKGVVLPGEVPGKWGWAEVSDKVRWKKPAERLEAVQMDRVFLAAILRRSAERAAASVPKAEVEAEVEKRYQRWVQSDKEREKTQVERLTEKIAEMERDLIVFEKASGVRVRESWDRVQIGEAVRAVINARFTGLSYKLDQEAERLKKLAEDAALAAQQVREAVKAQVNKEQGTLPLTN